MGTNHCLVIFCNWLVNYISLFYSTFLKKISALRVRIIYKCATEDYVEESQALTQVRRVLDIVACTTRFFPSPASKSSSNNKSAAVINGNTAAPEEELDMAAIHPTPKLSQFHEFFSIPNVSPPILRKSSLSSSDESLLKILLVTFL